MHSLQSTQTVTGLCNPTILVFGKMCMSVAYDSFILQPPISSECNPLKCLKGECFKGPQLLPYSPVIDYITARLRKMYHRLNLLH